MRILFFIFVFISSFSHARENQITVNLIHEKLGENPSAMESLVVKSGNEIKVSIRSNEIFKKNLDPSRIYILSLDLSKSERYYIQFMPNNAEYSLSSSTLIAHSGSKPFSGFRSGGSLMLTFGSVTSLSSSDLSSIRAEWLGLIDIE